MKHLSVSLRLLVSLSLLLFENNYFFRPCNFFQGDKNFGVLNRGSSKSSVIRSSQNEHIVKNKLLSYLIGIIQNFKHYCWIFDNFMLLPFYIDDSINLVWVRRHSNSVFFVMHYYQAIIRFRYLRRVGFFPGSLHGFFLERYFPEVYLCLVNFRIHIIASEFSDSSSIELFKVFRELSIRLLDNIHS